MTNEKKYEFCATENEGTMEPISRSNPNMCRRAHIYGLRNIQTGVVCFPSTYSSPFVQTHQVVYDMADVKINEDDCYVGKRFKRTKIRLKSSDNDVNMGLKYIFDSTRTTSEDWEVVRYVGNTQHDDVYDDGRFLVPYLNGYCGSGKYRSYDASLYNATRDFMATLREEKVVVSEELTEVEWETTTDWKIIKEIEVI